MPAVTQAWEKTLKRRQFSRRCGLRFASRVSRKITAPAAAVPLIGPADGEAYPIRSVAKMDAKDLEPLDDLPCGLAAYCLRCTTGREAALSQLIPFLHPDIQAYPLTQDKHQSVGGVKRVTQVSLLPGYLFLFTDAPLPYQSLMAMKDALLFLHYAGEEDILLREGDRRFAAWVYRHKGRIGMSKALAVGDRVVMVSGPMRDYAGVITKVDKHNRNGQVELSVCGKAFKVWLPFEWVASPEKASGAPGLPR